MKVAQHHNTTSSLVEFIEQRPYVNYLQEDYNK